MAELVASNQGDRVCPLRRFPPTKPLVIGAIGPRTAEELTGDALSALG